MTISARFKAFKFVNLENGCQCCISHSTNSSGHVNFVIGDRIRNLHKVLYECKYGIVPPGYHLHHECFNKRCVNTDHLKVLTHSEHASLHRKLQQREIRSPK